MNAIELPPSAAAEELSQGERHLSLNFLLFVLFTTLVVDSFGPGIEILREFGARPVNFLLAAAVCAICLLDFGKWRGVSLRLWRTLFIACVLLCVSLLNLWIALTRSGPDAATVASAWIRQFLMLAWGVTSYFTWKRLLSSVGEQSYARLLAASAVLPLLAFMLEYADPSGVMKSILDPFRVKGDLRPSGFSNEPSTYTAWVTFIWPIVLFIAARGRTARGRVLAALLAIVLAVSAYLSNARTGIVIFILQVAFFGYTKLRQQHAFGGVIRALIVASLCLAVSLIVVWDRLMSLTDMSPNSSEVARFGYTVAGFDLFLDYPWVGTGIGQFSYFFGQYVPAFAMGSAEVASYAFGLGKYRASTFNLFVRLLTEFGLPMALLLGGVILRPIVRAARSVGSSPFLLYAALSAIGGVGFWLSQDQYGYQPAILSLAVLTLTLERARAQGDAVRVSTGSEQGCHT
ncbi:MAG TPA: O-antigen ligase family protein [Steroidobacteraceae bacterium]|nr:O-antigen ligase family protein [Steroidobacteraceae bacterium]